MSFFLDKVFSSLVKQFFTAVKKTTHIQGKCIVILIIMIITINFPWQAAVNQKNLECAMTTIYTTARTPIRDADETMDKISFIVQ